MRSSSDSARQSAGAFGATVPPFGCRFVGMIDTDLIVRALRDRGHVVENVISVPENAGEYEFIIDGKTLTLVETRALLEAEEPK